MKVALTDFGKQILKELVERNMTQRELSEKVGCTKQYMHKILVGERSGGKYREKIREELGIN